MTIMTIYVSTKGMSDLVYFDVDIPDDIDG